MRKDKFVKTYMSDSSIQFVKFAVPFQDVNFIVKLFFYFSCFIATNFLVNKDVCVVEILMFPISYQRMQPMPAIRSITGEDSQSVQLI